MTKPTDDNINWDPNLSFDPTNVADPFATHGIPVPTYGNYGGPGYTAGTLGGTASVPADPPPVDPLDQLFYTHDLAIQRYAARRVRKRQCQEPSALRCRGAAGILPGGCVIQPRHHDQRSITRRSFPRSRTCRGCTFPGSANRRNRNWNERR